MRLSGLSFFEGDLKVYIKSVLVLLAVITIFSAEPSSAQEADPDSGFFQQSFGDLSEELQIVKDEGKTGVFVMFDDKDCPWCAKMKATVLNQQEVQAYYRKHFRVLRIDKNGDGLVTDFDGKEISEKDFADKNRVRATPVIVFYDTQGKAMHRYTGAARNVQEFMWLGEFIVEGDYKTTKFPVYKRQKKGGG